MNNKSGTNNKAERVEQRKAARRICDLFCKLCGKPEITEQRRVARVRNRRVHMANERTFLAWIRTSIGIMAFGFVVEKDRKSVV